MTTINWHTLNNGTLVADRGALTISNRSTRMPNYVLEVAGGNGLGYGTLEGALADAEKIILEPCIQGKVMSRALTLEVLETACAQPDLTLYRFMLLSDALAACRDGRPLMEYPIPSALKGILLDRWADYPNDRGATAHLAKMRYILEDPDVPLFGLLPAGPRKAVRVFVEGDSSVKGDEIFRIKG
jgi:hypothetical protein